MTPTQSDLHLRADTESVENLVARVKRGAVRVPSFQRPLRWSADDVQMLFDSIYHGYPIGSLLMRKAPAPAARVRYGPIEVTAPEIHDALWVVDGQQRLTALAAALSRPLPAPRTPADEWVLYFDAADRKFTIPPKSGELPTTWVPVAELLDASTLSEWVFNWTHKDDNTLRRAVFDAGTRIRQYEVPLYVVETSNEQFLREIFHRTNNSGKAMKWQEVHDALFGKPSDQPSTLAALAAELANMGLGEPEQDQLLTALVAFRGLDVTRSIADHYRKDPEVLRDAVRDALPALRGVLSFLQAHAEIPHLRLLPRSLPLVVLTRFFGLYPEPNARTTTLLVRWTWRTLLSFSSFDERTVLRHSINAVTPGNEEASVQRLLNVVPRTKAADFAVPPRFDARAAESRIVLVALSTLGPRRLEDAQPVDVARLVESSGVDAFRRLLPSEVKVGQSPANRMLLPGTGSARREVLEYARQSTAATEVLKSHALDRQCIEQLIAGKEAELILHRKGLIEVVVSALGNRLAAWGKNDRPSVRHVIRAAEEQ